MRLLFVFLLFSFISRFAFADLCDFVYKQNTNRNYSEDIKLIGKLNKLDSLIARVKKFNTKNIDIETELIKGNLNHAINTWGPVFRKTESSALHIENLEHLIKTVEKSFKFNHKNYESFLRENKIPEYLIKEHIGPLVKNGSEAYTKILLKSMRKQYRILGNNYQKYEQIRNSLDDMLGSKTCNASCKEAVSRLYDSIGVTSSAERHLYGPLVQNRNSISLIKVKTIFNNHPESLVIAKRKEFINEALVAIKKFANNTRLVRKLYYSFGQSQFVKNIKMVRMFKRIFDKRAFSLHNRIMTKISYADLSIPEKIKLLKKELEGMDLDAFLVDFSRSIDSKIQSSFEALKNHTLKTKSYSSLSNQFIEAEKLGAKIGKMSNSKPKDIGFILGSAITLGAGITYFSYTIADEGEIQAVSEDEEPIILEDEVILLKYGSNKDEEVFSTLDSITDSISRIKEN